MRIADQKDREMTLREPGTIVAGNADPTHKEHADSVCVASDFTAQIGTSAVQFARVTREVARVVPLCRTPQSPRALMQQLGLSDRKNFRRAYLRAALDAGMLERTIPDTPNNNQQRYRLTETGRRWLELNGQ
jgi:ATP-dependent DNA helicase RecG